MKEDRKEYCLACFCHPSLSFAPPPQNPPQFTLPCHTIARSGLQMYVSYPAVNHFIKLVPNRAMNESNEFACPPPSHYVLVGLLSLLLCLTEDWATLQCLTCLISLTAQETSYTSLQLRPYERIHEFTRRSQRTKCNYRPTKLPEP